MADSKRLWTSGARAAPRTGVVHRLAFASVEASGRGNDLVVMVPLYDQRRGLIMLRGDLLAAGHTDQSIQRMVRSGQWVRIRHGAYTEADSWDHLDPIDQHALRTRAVVAQSRTDVVVSHTSGLALRRAPAWGLSLDDVHVTRRDGRTGRRHAGVCQHRGLIDDGDVALHEGLPVMSATRLALEISTIAAVDVSLAVVNHFLHVGLTTRIDLEARYRSMDRWPWTLGTDLMLRLADERIESVGESRTLYLCFRHGLPAPVPQYPIRDEKGRVIARVDFAWPELGVFLEFDGMVKYEKLLRPGERASDVVVAEKRREELICRLTGWRCIRIVWADLERPEHTAYRIHLALTAA